MKTHTLGKTDIEVSEVCLGTMTYGEQNSQSEAEAQLDYALANGVTFIDTAEMYPVPVNPKTSNRTESMIGEWIAARQNRDKFVLATKVVGNGSWLPWVREGKAHPDASNIQAAIEGSLRRLQTDYIDLYQIHWPDRPTNYFGQLNYQAVADEAPWVAIEDTLGALQDLVAQGKIRAIGISNETPWGIAEYLRISRERDWARVATIQNPYNLLNRSFEIGMAEFSHRESVGLLAYSPLAFGALTGKYLDAKPEGARLTRWGDYFKRYTTPQAVDATRQYKAIADDVGLSLATLSLAYLRTKSFVTSTIIGATTMEQLEENISACQLDLSSEAIKRIEETYQVVQAAAP